MSDDVRAILGAIAAQFGHHDPERRSLWAARWNSEVATRDALRAIPIPEDTVPFNPASLVRRKPRRDWEDRAFIGKLPEGVGPRGALASDAHAFASGECTARQLVERRLHAIERHAQLHAFIDVFAESSFERARVIDLRRAEGDEVGPLAGVTLAIKDLFDLEGRATRAGIEGLEHAIAERTATAVTLLEEEDAIGVGLANMHPLAYGTTSHNPIYGRVLNPFVHSAVAGGSSGGSAVAVAMGMASLALGTDTGGSIRIPAACCGVVGLKPTYGRISARGVYPLARSLDHIGPITATVEDAAIAFEMLADEPCPAAWSQWSDLSHIRAAIVTTHFMEHVSEEVAGMIASVRAGIEACGGEIEEIDVPAFTSLGTTVWATISAESLEVNARLLRDHGERIPEDVRVRLEMGMFVTAADYVRAQRVRAAAAVALDEVFDHVDLLIVPTLAMPVPDADTASVRAGSAEFALGPAMSRLTNPFNALGLPALALPWGKDARGIPLSVQLVAAPMDEVAILGTGRVLERFALGAGLEVSAIGG